MKIGFIADIHEDVTRLNESIKILEDNKCDKIVCLGDFIGYSMPYYGFLSSRNGHEVISIIKKKCNVVVVGNHDLYAVKKLPKYKASFNYPLNWYSLDFWKRKKLANKKVNLYEDNELSGLLTKQDINYIKKLPEYAVVDFDGLRVLLSHWTFPDLSGSLTFEPSKPEEFKEHFEFMRKNKCNIGIHGHDHRRILSFSSKKMQELSFGTKIKITNEPIGFYCPCVANGTFPNGVMILDTNKKDLEIIPLNTPLHIAPDWRKK